MWDSIVLYYLCVGENSTGVVFYLKIVSEDVIYFS
jgi:hypothetical protein